MKPLKGNQQLGYGSQGVLCGAPGVKTQNLLPEEEGAWMQAPIAVPTPFVAKLCKPTVGLGANHHPM
ncbi:MAG: hypothetical protein WA485_11235 [Candidatus Sulfotelmatobacter sp.]